jgi:hypothetical protein
MLANDLLLPFLTSLSLVPLRLLLALFDLRKRIMSVQISLESFLITQLTRKLLLRSVEPFNTVDKFLDFERSRLSILALNNSSFPEDVNSILNLQGFISKARVDLALCEVTEYAPYLLVILFEKLFRDLVLFLHK